MDLYPSVKPLKVEKLPDQKELAPKGMVRVSVYERRVGRKAFKKGT